MDAENRGDPLEEIRGWLEGLGGRDLTDAEVEEAVQRLLRAGPPALPILLEQFTTEDETLLAVATQALKVWESPDPVQPLLDLLRQPATGDLAKALILNVLERRGLDVDDPALLGLAINLEEYLGEPAGGGNGKGEGS
ncbi:MAG TPA: hypothetical protein VLT62_29270 [Candidatus Methylomirabilis sp.]|nr:hypothetical protein [Candidatus Methylomirabilis sp.]